MNYLLGLDIGTSGVKAVLVSAEGELIATETSSYPLSSPKDGWVEQNPEDWWESTAEVINKIITKSNIASKNLKGISLSGQMHSSVFLDKKRQVIRPAILWSDTRTSQQCKDIYNKVGGFENLIKYVSNPALEGFTAPKIIWLQKNEPKNYKKVDIVLLPKDYIRYRLTGEIGTEVSDAAGTLLFNVDKKKWSEKLLKQLNIDSSILPPVYESIAVTGEVNSYAAEETGLKKGIPVVAGGADNACGAAGSGVMKEGRVMVSIGSSGVVLAPINSPEADKQGRIHLFNHTRPDSWYMMGVMLSAGMSYSWLQEKMYGDHLDYTKLDNLAKKVSTGSNGLLFLPYLFGERTPHADSNARGVFFGISNEHSEGHFARSVMEGVAFGLRDSLELIKGKGVEIEEVRAIGGGAKSKIWQRILADVFGTEILLLEVEEGPAFGAALIAGVGVGLFSDFEEVEKNIISIKDRVFPVKENTKCYDEYYQIYRRLYTSLEKDFKTLSQIRS